MSSSLFSLYETMDGVLVNDLNLSPRSNHLCQLYLSIFLAVELLIASQACTLARSIDLGFFIVVDVFCSVDL